MKAQAAKIQTLLQSYSDYPTSDRRDQLIRLHVGLVRKLLHQFCLQTSASGDLEAIALQALARAIDAYHPSQGQPFSHFAIPFIWQELQGYTQPRLGRTAEVVALAR